MAVAKKDQERVTYAWMYGAQARKDGKEPDVPIGRTGATHGCRALTASRRRCSQDQAGQRRDGS
jgi:hypothetical protein